MKTVQPWLTQIIKLGRRWSLGGLGTLSLSLGLAGGLWGVEIAIAPQVAQAYTAREDITLDRRPDDTFQTFVRRAEMVARAAAQRSFDNDILITEVEITILGESQGSIAPILLLNVTRQSWRNTPDPQQWATYFPFSETLLRFDQSLPENNTASSPAPNQTQPQNQNTTPPPQSPQTPSPQEEQTTVQPTQNPSQPSAPPTLLTPPGETGETLSP